MKFAMNSARALLLLRLNARPPLLVLMFLATSGCDAWFWRRIDLTESQAAVAPNRDDGTSVLEAVREYARRESIPCKDAGRLPIECWRQPIRIWAVEEGKAITVCYAAVGIPLESGKFARRMDEFEALIRERVGTAVTVVPVHCPNPPMHLNTRDL